jgi:hypothetical protein
MSGTTNTVQAWQEIRAHSGWRQAGFLEPRTVIAKAWSVEAVMQRPIDLAKIGQQPAQCAGDPAHPASQSPRRSPHRRYCRFAQTFIGERVFLRVGGAAKGAEVDPVLFPQQPIQVVEQSVMPFDRAQAGNRRARFDMNEREAAIATLRRHRGRIEPEGFDREDDFVIRQRLIMTDEQTTVCA